ncbi:MAG: HAD family hydrolase, partial [Ignavibacteriales bacterium]|nr:HAD family hydrolase [Ignavibacteriales bacterium]
TNELIFATFNHVAEKYLGRKYSPEEITKMFGPSEEIAVGRLIDKEHIDEAMEDFYSFYEAHHPKMANAYDGVREMLDFLKERGLLLAIFTGKGKRSALITLEEIGLKNYFDVIITGDDVQNHKPSADGIKKVMARFGLEPDQVLMVGDAVADVKAAHEAGVKIAAVLWDSYGRDKVMQMEVDYSFHNVSEFVEWLKISIRNGGKSVDQ